MGWLLALALGLADTPAPAASVDPPPITLDLVVRDAHHRPVDRLSPADLTVLEQGVPRPVASLVRVQAPARTIAIFLDEFHVTSGPEAERARQALIELVSSLGEGDTVVVLKPLDSLLNIQVGPGRRDEALQALRTFAPRQDDLEPRSDFERQFIAGAPPQIAAARAQISASVLSALVTALGAADGGRKTLFVVSDGFARRGSTRGEAVAASFDTVARAANRAHVSVYPLDLTAPDAGAEPDARERARASLQALATGTAGRVVTAAAPDVRDAAGDAGDYYLATLAPSAQVGDSRMHEVTVSVRTRGVSVRSRPAYFSQSLADRARIAAIFAPPPERPAPVMRRTSALIRPWFGMSRAANGQTQVEFAWEPALPAAGVRPPPLQAAQVRMSVTTDDGRSLFEGVVAPSVVSGGSAVPTRASFASPPGRVLVQMAIEDASARLLDRDVRDLAVTAFPDALVIGTPEVRRARTARDLARIAATDAPISVSRQFSRAESIVVRVPVSSADAALSARLVSQPGSVLRTFEPQPVASRPGYYELQLPLGWLASGTYTLEFSAVSGAARAGERLVFRVTP